ncbi:MAG: quinone-dependent dihydroorotate dehydrogenase [Methylobacteriaceae bacterium]|nr:quinone-dependent dihydroorotate dehydrogenase [Methylobacteriaceae bacterium]
MAYRALGPALAHLDPEAAHRLAIAGLRRAPLPPAAPDDPILATTLWGRDFPNALGLAAGFDKHGEAPDACLALGFGHVEIGGVTPRPQPGNPRPRVFRLAEDRAVINRYGLNSDGLTVVAARLARRTRRGLVGANLGKNKDSLDEVADYVAGMRALGPHVDFAVINVSSPNTPGLRDLQGRVAMAGIVRAVAAARDATEPRPALLVKLAPDLDDAALADAAEVALECRLDGLVMGNTTVARPASLRSSARSETGGLSGAPLLAFSTGKLRDLYRLTGGRVPLVGCGGVASGADAYAKIRAGASLVQLYTALVYEGPGLVPRIKRELAALLRRDGFRSVAEAVGADHG